MLMWIDSHVMQSITSAKTIKKLDIVYSTHGLLRKIVTDSGPAFVSEEFKTFWKGMVSNISQHHLTIYPQMVKWNEQYKLLIMHSDVEK